MSRQRLIHPDIFTSEDFNSLPLGARLLFIGMFTLADDYGRGRGSPVALKMGVFPNDPETGPDLVQTWSRLVHDRGMATFYRTGSSVFYELTAWDRWQKPKYKSTSKIPPAQGLIPIFPRSSPDLPPIGSTRGEESRGEERRGEYIISLRASSIATARAREDAAPPHNPVTDSVSPDEGGTNGRTDDGPTGPPPKQYVRDVGALQLCHATLKTLDARLLERGRGDLRKRALNEITPLGFDQEIETVALACPADLRDALIGWHEGQGMKGAAAALRVQLVVERGAGA